MKPLVIATALIFSSNAVADWIEFSTAPNGDIHFYDASRVDIQGDQITIWTRIRYKATVMAASSYQSLLKLDCSKHTEQTLQDTFYTDKAWSQPAMATNTHPKPAKKLAEKSAAAALAARLCKD